MTSATDFELRAEPFRRELLAHCYQMLGSVQDAEDLVQETMLRAWRARDRYDEGRASLRTWLYRIATNACLNALQSRKRRPLPSQVVVAGEDPEGPLVPGGEVTWLQPLPDALLGSDRNDPAVLLATRGALRLALIAAMQVLPAKQRAVLILREVLDYSPAEIADMLETTAAGVNSALQRARARLNQVEIFEDEVAEPSNPDRQALLNRYITAFERADAAGLARLLTDEAVIEMPPMLNWYAGRPSYERFLTHIFAGRHGDWRVLHTAANGQPAVVGYLRSDSGDYELRILQVLTIEGGRISRIVAFLDPASFATSALPATLDPGATSL